MSQVALVEGGMSVARGPRHVQLVATLPGRFGASVLTVTSTFDVERRFLSREMRYVGGIYVRRSGYAFAEIRGIGLKAYIDTDTKDKSYLPVVTLKTGRRRYLAFLNAVAPAYEPAIEVACEITGFPRVDHPGSKWGW